MEARTLETKLAGVQTIAQYEQLLYEVGGGRVSRSEAKAMTSGIVAAIRAEKARKPVQDLIIKLLEIRCSWLKTVIGERQA
jgi:hypothetical protein